MKTNELRQTEEFKKLVLRYGLAVELYLEHLTIEETWSCESAEAFREQFESKYRFSFGNADIFKWMWLRNVAMPEKYKSYVDARLLLADVLDTECVCFKKYGLNFLFEKP